MNKQEYMSALIEALSIFDESVRTEIIEDYEEHFAAGKANGKTEEEIVAELGSIEELVNDLKELSGNGQNGGSEGTAEKDWENMAKDIVKSVANFIGTMAGTITKNAGKVTENVFDGAESFAESFASGFDAAAEKVVSKSTEFAKEVVSSYKAAAGTAETEAADKTEGEAEEAPTEAATAVCLNVVADTDCGDIIITASDDDSIHASYENNGTVNQQLAYKFEFKESGDNFVVSVKKQSGNAFFFKAMPNPEIKLYISVPAFIKGITAHSMSGDISMENLTAESIELSSMSGDITVNGARVEGEFVSNTMSGDLNANSISALAVELKSMSGDSRFSGSARDVKVSSTSGDSRVETEGAEKVTATSISGDVKVTLVNATGYRADVKSTSGDITLKFGDERYTDAKNAQYTLGDGSVEVYASSVSGDVCIKAE